MIFDRLPKGKRDRFWTHGGVRASSVLETKLRRSFTCKPVNLFFLCGIRFWRKFLRDFSLELPDQPI